MNAKSTTPLIIDEGYLQLSKEKITMTTPVPLRTLSSGVTGAGFKKNKHFVNRYVDINYQCEDHREEMKAYLKGHSFPPNETIGMMTAVKLKNVAYDFIDLNGFSLFIVITAGIRNAVDASLGHKHMPHILPGTINSWIFINGKLTEEAFIQGVVTATEAKTKALQDLEIKDQETETIATGTSTDSIAIAATQEGALLDYAGPITVLGREIATHVYRLTKMAIERNNLQK